MLSDAVCRSRGLHTPLNGDVVWNYASHLFPNSRSGGMDCETVKIVISTGDWLGDGSPEKCFFYASRQFGGEL